MSQIPIYSTRGHWAAILVDQRLIFNTEGDWIGWVTHDRGVYSIRGEYAGWLADDNRILRYRHTSPLLPRLSPPPPPPRPQLPPSVPLAPLMADLRFDVIDLFDDAPHRLDPYDLDEVYDLD
jgi:hypothetical protein